MAIRFRCRHCNQLLGIARRKAGTPVECPTCHQQLTVPPTDQEGIDEPAGVPAAPGAPPPPPLFERSDFEAYLEGAAGDHAPRRPPTPAAPPPPPALAPVPPAPHAGSPYEAEHLAGHEPSLSSGPALPAGIVLSPTWATLLTVVGILLLALSFSIGLLVGRNL